MGGGRERVNVPPRDQRLGGLGIGGQGVSWISLHALRHNASADRMQYYHSFRCRIATWHGSCVSWWHNKDAPVPLGLNHVIVSLHFHSRYAEQRVNDSWVLEGTDRLGIGNRDD